MAVEAVVRGVKASRFLPLEKVEGMADRECHLPRLLVCLTLKPLLLQQAFCEAVPWLWPLLLLEQQR